MDWSQVFEIFTRPLFHLGETPVSMASVVQFVTLITLVLLAARVVRRLLRSRLLAKLPMGMGQKDAITRLVGYLVLVLGFLIVLQTLGLDLTTLTVLVGGSAYWHFGLEFH